jgi:hypothetical protein
MALIFLPTYLFAAAAVTPSIVFQRLSRRLREARELGAYELIEPLRAGWAKCGVRGIGGSPARPPSS